MTADTSELSAYTIFDQYANLKKATYYKIEIKKI